MTSSVTDLTDVNEMCFSNVLDQYLELRALGPNESDGYTDKRYYRRMEDLRERMDQLAPTPAAPALPDGRLDAALKSIEGMTIAGNGAAELGALMREQYASRRGVYPDGNPNAANWHLSHQAQPEAQGPFGWVAMDKDGLVRREAWRRREFFGAILDDDAGKFDAEDLARLDRDFAGCAPHRCVSIYARPEAPAVPAGWVHRGDLEAMARGTRGAIAWSSRQGPDDVPIYSSPCSAPAVSAITDDAVSKAIKRAWQLGQTYWQQADSDSWTQNKKSDETQAKLYVLIEETCAMLAPVAPAVSTMVTSRMVSDLRAETDEPMVRCKRALQACAGDASKAREWLRSHHPMVASPPEAPAVPVPPMLTDEQIDTVVRQLTDAYGKLCEVEDTRMFAHAIIAERDKQWLAASGTPTPKATP